MKINSISKHFGLTWATRNRSGVLSNRRRRFRAAAGGLVAASGLALTLVGVPNGGAAADPAPPTPIDQSAVAVWANANALWGGAPTSLGVSTNAAGGGGAVIKAPNRGAVDLTGLAAWAQANGMRGVSPASLHEAPPQQVADA